MSEHINIKFPISDGDRGYYFNSNTTTRDAIVSDILHILVTKKGDRFMNPNFGTNLHSFLFEPSDAITLSDIKRDLNESLIFTMPNVQIKSLEAEYDETGLISEVKLVAIDTDDIFLEEININLNI